MRTWFALIALLVAGLLPLQSALATQAATQTAARACCNEDCPGSAPCAHAACQVCASPAVAVGATRPAAWASPGPVFVSAAAVGLPDAWASIWCPPD